MFISFVDSISMLSVSVNGIVGRWKIMDLVDKIIGW